MKEGQMAGKDGNASFREHDIEFLQKRTKLWLEAVLGETYGDRTLAELIGDGNLLYRVSKYITREITGASPGPQEISPQTFLEVSAYGKKSGKYLPYANVDTFLKTCRKVGLTDVELFTPPDAVEGKDTRRVCTSIRSLARKARAQLIRVPDFEDVNQPLPMPKEKVGEIKEHLQHSNSTPAASIAVTPEADIQKSERVQIISRFLSATKSSANVSEEDNMARPSDGSSPVTPGQLKSIHSFSSNNSTSWKSPSTPTATIGGIGTPRLGKSVSLIEPSLVHINSSESSFPSALDMKSPDQPNPEKPTVTPSSVQPVDQSNAAQLSYSQKGLGSFRHAQPHFVKTSSVQSKMPNTSNDHLDKVTAPEPKPGKTPSTPAAPSDHPLDQTKVRSSLSGAYRHPQPHFSFKKSSQGDLSESSPHSQDLQSKFLEAQPDGDAPKTPSMKPKKALSSNKIVEKEPSSNTQQSETLVKTTSRAVTEVSQGSTGRAKEPVSKPETKVPGMQLNSKVWMPLVAGALTFLGTFLVIKTRDPSEYEVKRGDTLSKISKQVGKNSWDELVKLNPSITNPHLIYPSERLKLPTDRSKHFPS